MFARDGEWINTENIVSPHEVIRTLFFKMSMFPGIGILTNLIFKNLACFANQDSLYSLFTIPRFLMLFDNSDMFL